MYVALNFLQQILKSIEIIISSSPLVILPTMRNSFMMLLVLLIMSLLLNVSAKYNYKEALTKSLLYFEAQRSGQLPANQRVTWRGNSALHDGQEAGVNLVGGYYDAGDNVKFGFPMAFTVTMLSWGVVEFTAHFKAQHELQNALEAIKWGTDYLIKAHPKPNLLYAGVGDGDADHQCWQRPEDMTTPRTVYKIDEQNPGSDLAGETAAAFAAASLAFKGVDDKYSQLLVSHAKQLFDFAKRYQRKYSDSIPSHAKFYSSSNFQDELLWGAAWLERATGEKEYRDLLNDSRNAPGGTRSLFSWDDKFVGAQILAAKLVLEGREKWEGYKKAGEEFICNCIQKGSNNVVRTNGGLLWFDGYNNLQYTASASLALAVYADYLSATNNILSCGSTHVPPSELFDFVLYQVDYILGANPRNISYMVGYGSNYPQKVHHRGASIVSIKKDPTPVGCKEGFDKWYNNNQPNPNAFIGAIVGGPDRNDNYADERSNFMLAQPPTVNNAALIGVLARIA